jgi:hypothetical protein
LYPESWCLSLEGKNSERQTVDQRIADAAKAVFEEQGKFCMSMAK